MSLGADPFQAAFDRLFRPGEARDRDERRERKLATLDAQGAALAAEQAEGSASFRAKLAALAGALALGVAAWAAWRWSQKPKRRRRVR